jgi:hypothetical protein
MKKQRPLMSQPNFGKFEKHETKPRWLSAYQRAASSQSTSKKANRSGSKGAI